MVEVLLEEREKNHPAQGHLVWWGRKARYWDFDFIEFAPQEKLDLLQTAIEDSIAEMAIVYNAPELIDLIVDIEVCGSYAYGTQRWWSDFDIQLVAKNYGHQRKIENIIVPKSSLVKIVGYDLTNKLKHAIEIHYSVNNNKKYNEVYSLRERKLYNRTEGTKLSDRHHRRFKSNQGKGIENGKYEILDRTPPHCEGDYWDDNGDEKYK